MLMGVRAEREREAWHGMANGVLGKGKSHKMTPGYLRPGRGAGICFGRERVIK
jgi:hypothetical protein